jgi:hypothetical protein
VGYFQLEGERKICNKQREQLDHLESDLALLSSNHTAALVSMVRLLDRISAVEESLFSLFYCLRDIQISKENPKSIFCANPACNPAK